MRAGVFQSSFALVLCLHVGCSALEGSGRTHDTARPVRWQLVERRYGDLPGGGRSGDGRVDEDGTVLVFQPLYREDLLTEIFVSAFPEGLELVSLSHRRAPVGTLVTAHVRLRDADPEGVYLVTASGSTPHVRLLGKKSLIVRGHDTARFRFTSDAAGRGGLALSVERLQ